MNPHVVPSGHVDVDEHTHQITLNLDACLAEVDAFAAQSISPGPPAPDRIASHAAMPSWSKPSDPKGPTAQDQ